MKKSSSWGLGLGLVFVIGIGVGVFIHHQTNQRANANEAPYRELERFAKILEFVESNYVEDIKSPELIEGAIKGMINTLDPHSAYLTAEMYHEMKVETSGKFGGVGVEVTIKDGIILVVTPIDETPAFKAGLKSGDQITRIDGHDSKSLSLQEAINVMRGKVGSKIKLTILRKGLPKPFDVVLTRESIRLQSVRSTPLENGVGYLRISSFMEKTADDTAKAIEKFKKQQGGLSALILDLRGNPGGLLEQAVKVVNLFVDEGPVVYTIGRDRSKKEIEYAQKGRMITDVPLVVLVDGSSASASEIVSGALQDYGRAVIVGTRTFGKGSVQTIIPVGEETGLKLTIARYYTPSGRSIQVKGIDPDVVIEPVDPKLFAQMQAQRRRRTFSEADLERHFGNEKDPEAEKDRVTDDEDGSGGDEAASAATAGLTLEERVKKDFMVAQAKGVLRTMAVMKSGQKKPVFQILEEPKSKESDKHE